MPLMFKILRQLRRASQIAFLLLFFYLLWKAAFRDALNAAGDLDHIGHRVCLFFEIDPLTAVANVLSTHALYRGLVWSLIIIIPTLFLGRFFCGWICPFGTLNHFFGGLRSERKRGRQKIDSNRYHRWQTFKYYLLIAVLIAALLGSGLAGLFDPISLLVRSLTASVLPAINYAGSALIETLRGSDFWPFRILGHQMQLHLGANAASPLLSFRQPHFRQAFLLGAVFVFLLSLNLRITRFWCRALCPLGALLGVFSRWSILDLHKRSGSCGDCNRCLLYCQGADDPVTGARWRKAECHLCLNCVAECPDGALSFRLLRPAADTLERPDLSRRRTLTGVGAGLAIIPLLRSATVFQAEHDERLLRPPGALKESEFLSRCIRCDECVRVCPNNALHPALTEAGLEGLWSPVLVPRIGYCEPSCVLCGEACPTGAIWQITPREKGWVTGAQTDKPIRLGTAFYDRGRCLPWAMATDCIVCEEWCHLAKSNLSRRGRSPRRGREP